ncbi:MAG: hypothetical protein Rhims3KO_26430 [Hyphomicrobiales bacterium]
MKINNKVAGRAEWDVGNCASGAPVGTDDMAGLSDEANKNAALELILPWEAQTLTGDAK